MAGTSNSTIKIELNPRDRRLFESILRELRKINEDENEEVWPPYDH